VFGAALTGGLVAAHRSGRELPERLGARDLLLAGIATHKLSRLITKDKITSAVRAPFTRFQEKAGHGELDEAARGRAAMWTVHAIADAAQLVYSAAEDRS
jgi:hypothetical protein